MLSINKIADKTKYTIKFIRREVASGNLKSIKMNSRYLINEKDFLNWEKNKILKVDKKCANKNCNSKKDLVNWVDISEDFQKIDAWNNKKQLTEYNFIDLFAGAGGLSCGLVMAGFNPIGTVEILEPAVETYKYNFNQQKGFDESLEARDITDEKVKIDLINRVKGKHIDLIAGGFPCQGFSIAGNRIIDDKRNKLYREMLDIVNRLKPDYVLMENVEGLRTMLNGQVEKKIISDYAKIGYNINVTTLCAADYGVPQLRKRVIFIGNRMNKTNYHPRPFVLPENYKTVGDAIAKYVDCSENKDINHEFTKHSKEMIRKLKNVKEGESLYKNYSDGWKKVFWNKPSITVKENHGGVNIHPLLPRVMTPRELAALQSFPDDFIFKGTKKWQLVQIGNAVPPLLGKAIGLSIIKSIEEK